MFLIPLAGGLFIIDSWNGISKELNFIGLKNYLNILDDTRLNSLKNNLKLTVSCCYC